MRLIHNEKYTDRQMTEFRDNVLANSIAAVITMLEATDTLGIKIDDAVAAAAKARLLSDKSLRSMVAGDKVLQAFASVAADLKLLWKDPGVQTVFGRANEYQLDDSAQL